MCLLLQGACKEIQRGGYADPIGWEKLPSNWSEFWHWFCYSWGFGFTVWIYSLFQSDDLFWKKWSIYWSIMWFPIKNVGLYSSSGATVYMLCRNKDRGEAALNQIRSKTGNANVHLEVWCLLILLHVWKIQLFFMTMCVGYEKIRLNTIIMWQICDLSSINEVKSFATKFTSMDKPLHVLVSTAVSNTLQFCFYPSCLLFLCQCFKVSLNQINQMLE
jgi:hypothetical protein